MRWLAVVFVAGVLVFSLVSLVSGGTTTGVRTPGGYTAQWFAGCSSGSTGPHQCLSGRGDNSAALCPASSTGATGMVQNCNECYCNTASGVNNYNCTFGTCSFCPSVCTLGQEGYSDCAGSVEEPRHLNCFIIGGRCDETYGCECNDGVGGLCGQNGAWSSCEQNNPDHDCGSASGTESRDERRCYDGPGGSCTWRERTRSCSVNLGSCSSGYYCSSNKCEQCPCSTGDFDYQCSGSEVQYRGCPGGCQWGGWTTGADCSEDQYQNECLEGESSRCRETDTGAGCVCE